ncbi:MAG: hypothetical protein FJ040_04600 [Chloroflexi bacterium]|nr:hypothetical protein [Chloroflexota bacterium]
MPKMSRAERKRLGVQRPVASAVSASIPENAGDIIDEALATVQASNPPAIEPQSRLVRTTRRVVARDVAASLDYSAETAMIATDLRRIAFWGTLFVAIMLAIKFSGLL